MRKKSPFKYCVLFHKGLDDPGQPIPNDTHWDTLRDAERERFKREEYLEEHQRKDLGWHYTVIKVPRKKQQGLLPNLKKPRGLLR
ncbi:MAG: hypothetical protein HY313_11985 [Acidobacteria bacterium]|nr:hypothetical protein [Acidobacteriota bacterium]